MYLHDADWQPEFFRAEAQAQPQLNEEEGIAQRYANDERSKTAA
jgi:hypothetical protein